MDLHVTIIGGAGVTRTVPGMYPVPLRPDPMDQPTVQAITLRLWWSTSLQDQRLGATYPHRIAWKVISRNVAVIRLPNCHNS